MESSPEEGELHFCLGVISCVLSPLAVGLGFLRFYGGVGLLVDDIGPCWAALETGARGGEPACISGVSNNKLSGSFSLSPLHRKKGERHSGADLVSSPSIPVASLAPEGMGSREIVDQCTYSFLVA